MAIKVGSRVMVMDFPGDIEAVVVGKMGDYCALQYGRGSVWWLPESELLELPAPAGRTILEQYKEG